MPIANPPDDFDDLSFDEDTGQFSSNVVWNGEATELNFCMEESQLSHGKRTAQRLMQNQSKWQGKAENLAARKLRRLRNRDWRGDDEPSLSQGEFKSRLGLMSISIYPKNRFSFWYDDGGLFAGHIIEIRGSLFWGLTSADLMG